MNILIINSSKEWGGTEKWSLSAAIGLSEMGHNIYFGCRSNNFQQKAASMNKTVNFVTFPFTNFIDIVTIFKLRSFYKKNKINVVIPSMQRDYFLGGLAAKLFTKTKVVGRYGIDRPINNLRNWIVFCKLFDIVIVNAKRIPEILSETKAFNINKCKVIYNGVELIESNPEIRKRMRDTLKISDSQICIMGIGRVARQKGYDFALKAFSSLVKQTADLRLVFVGEGDIERHQQIASDYGIADKVIFTGFRNDINHIIQAMDIFWLTSRSEGMPNAMLESMSAAKPVVAFDIAGISEIIKDDYNGLLIPFEDTELLSKRTFELINNADKMKQLGQNGYETVKNNHSVKKMVLNVEKHLLDLFK